jgi:hypothetical protein
MMTILAAFHNATKLSFNIEHDLDEVSELLFALLWMWMEALKISCPLRM